MRIKSPAPRELWGAVGMMPAGTEPSRTTPKISREPLSLTLPPAPPRSRRRRPALALSPRCPRGLNDPAAPGSARGREQCPGTPGQTPEHAGTGAAPGAWGPLCPHPERGGSQCPLIPKGEIPMSPHPKRGDPNVPSSQRGDPHVPSSQKGPVPKNRPDLGNGAGTPARPVGFLCLN